MNNSQNASFLGNVAKFCCDNSSTIKFPQLTFVLPNKRAVMFLKSYLRRNTKNTVMLPRFMTMRTFIDLLAESPEIGDMQGVFTLYDAYRRVLSKKGRRESVREFDSFIFWGDMMISDFNDIDKSLASAKDIFKNLKDVKELQANYLNDDQKEVVNRIWGESRLTAKIEEFWLHLADSGDGESLSSKFIYLWEILSDIYSEYNKILDEKGLLSTGAQYRSAVNRLRSEESEIKGTYAFVGFNDPSIAETIIFNHLKKSGNALFFWDTAPLKLCESANSMPKPLLRLRELVRSFPNPEGFHCEMAPEHLVEVTSVPSNVAQAKAVATVLRQWEEQGLFDPENPINTAIVIPDPGLLLPTLLSLPESIKSINISLGLPYRTTTFASLLHSIISMQLRSRRIHGICNFFYEDVIAVLRHPHIRAVASDSADEITEMIEKGKLFNIAAIDITQKAPALGAVFTPIIDMNEAAGVSAYLDNLLRWLGEALAAEKETNPSAAPSFELDAIDYFRNELEKLTSLIESHNVDMSNSTFMQLFERVFSSRALELSGKPLQGLQILGVLETRTLDFDNVIILSMNEGVFPKRQYAKTMIPNNLRHGYSLPDFENLERTYAYCFYRLLARAGHVAMFYDSRSDGKGNGERSRYIEQIKHLMPVLDIVEHDMTVCATKTPQRVFEIEKDDTVLRELDQLRPGGRLKFSAASLKEYFHCPLSFYLKFVRNLRSSDEMVNFLTAADYGNLVHNSIEALFAPYKNQLISAAVYDNWLDENNPLIEETVTQELLKNRFGDAALKNGGELDAEGTIALRTISTIVRADLKAEKERYCSEGKTFVFIDNEKKVNTLELNSEWKIDDDLSINFTMSIDRVDSIEPGMLRFIDYKTGKENTGVKGVYSLFDRMTKDCGGMLQVFTYCEAYLSIVDSDCDIVPFIHPMKELTKGEGIESLRLNNKPINSYKTDVREEFKPMLAGLFHEIFDPAKPFMQREADQGCNYCEFRSLCGRQKIEH